LLATSTSLSTLYPADTMQISFSKRTQLLLKVSFLVTFAESMLVPMYAAFTEKVGGSILDASIAYGLFSIASGVVIGLVGTRECFEKNTGHFLMAGFLTSVVCDVAYVFVQNKWQLFATQVVAGLATGLIEPAWDAMFTDGIETSATKHWSIWAGGTHLLTGVAAFAGGLIAAWFSFTVLFITMASIDMVAVFLCWRGGLRGTVRGDDPAPVAVLANEGSI
jgi:MFS family permease